MLYLVPWAQIDHWLLTFNKNRHKITIPAENRLNNVKSFWFFTNKNRTINIKPPSRQAPYKVWTLKYLFPSDDCYAHNLLRTLSYKCLDLSAILQNSKEGVVKIKTNKVKKECFFIS